MVAKGVREGSLGIGDAHYSLFFFLAMPQHADVPRPGIEFEARDDPGRCRDSAGSLTT